MRATCPWKEDLNLEIREAEILEWIAANFLILNTFLKNDRVKIEEVALR